MKNILVSFLLIAGLFAQTSKPTTASSPLPAAPSPAAPSEQTVNEFMRHMFGYDASLKWQVARITPNESGLTEVLVTVSNQQGQQQALRLYVTADGKSAINGDLVPFGADPFARARQQLKAVNGPAEGPADAPLVIVEFGDLQCPSCKQAQPIIERVLQENPNTRFVFQQYPLTAMHDWAMKAATYGDCLGRQNPAAFFKFAHSVYEAQGDINKDNSDAKLKPLVEAAGGNLDQVTACIATPETQQRVQASMKLGTEAGVTGTPTFFINGRKFTNLAGMQYDVLSTLVKFQATLPKD